MQRRRMIELPPLRVRLFSQHFSTNTSLWVRSLHLALRRRARATWPPKSAWSYQNGRENGKNSAVALRVPPEGRLRRSQEVGSR